MALTQDPYEISENEDAPDAGQGIEGNNQNPAEENQL